MDQNLQAVLDRLEKIEARIAVIENSPGAYRPPSLPQGRVVIDKSDRDRRPAKPVTPAKHVPAKDPQGEALRAKRQAAYNDRMTAIYTDADRTRQVARDIGGLAGGDGVAIVLSESIDYCQTVAAALHRNVGAAVITEETTERQRDGILARIQAGDIRVAVMTRQIFKIEPIDPELIDVVYLSSPIKMDDDLLNPLCRWLLPQPAKATWAKLLGYSDTSVEGLRDSVRTRLRDVFGRRR